MSMNKYSRERIIDGCKRCLNDIDSGIGDLKENYIQEELQDRTWRSFIRKPTYAGVKKDLEENDMQYFGLGFTYGKQKLKVQDLLRFVMEVEEEHIYLHPNYFNPILNSPRGLPL